MENAEGLDNLKRAIMGQQYGTRADPDRRGLGGNTVDQDFQAQDSRVPESRDARQSSSDGTRADRSAGLARSYCAARRQE